MTTIEKKQENLLLMHFKIEELEQRLEMTEAGWPDDPNKPKCPKWKA
jgi:hypothetical protein